MAMYMKPHFPKAEFIVSASAWGTGAEIRSAVKIIKSAIHSGLETDEIVIISSSNPMHLHGRVKLWWSRCRPTGTEVILVPANHSFTPKEWVQETVKFFRDLVRVVFTKK